MQISQPIIILLKRLWIQISLRRRRQFWALLFLMILSSFMEILSIGTVLPFLGALTAPERIFELPIVQPFIQALNITKPSQLLLPLTISFTIASLVAAIIRLFLLWASTKLSHAVGADLSVSIFRRTLYQPYAAHCARNSSEVISGISNKSVSVINAIVSILNILSSFVILITILIAMLLVSPIITLIAFGIFSLIYVSIINLTRRRLLINSQINARESVRVTKYMQEGLGGIRDIIIDGCQSTYCQIYENADLALRRSQGNNMFISSSPRFVMEAFGMVLISWLAYSLNQQEDGILKVIPVLGALAIGAQRMLPLLQQIYSSWTNIRGAQVPLQDTLELLDQPLPENFNSTITQPLIFKKHINLKKIGFRYNSETPYVIKEINFSIPKGSRFGFIGTSGSGKSTLLDIIMGLLHPSYGSLEVDGVIISSNNQRAWQDHIAHVPQAIFLADSSIAENIAFGVSKDQVDFERIHQVAEQARIAEFIETLPMQYQTLVGERGVRLSGGQRQRIGIARALYKRADVIILDEATSALDAETEEAVMEAIESLSEDITLLIIAHRITTLKNCTHILEIDCGVIKRIGNYQDISN